MKIRTIFFLHVHYCVGGTIAFFRTRGELEVRPILSQNWKSCQSDLILNECAVMHFWPYYWWATQKTVKSKSRNCVFI